MDDQVKEIYKLAELLIEKTAFSKKIISIKPIYKGGNNQLYYIKHNDSQFVLKRFYKHHDDHRNRLGSEYSFLKFANQCAPDNTPKIFCKDEVNSTALYEFVEGKKITSDNEIKSHHIDVAANFISRLNEKNHHDYTNLQNASEACFSLDDHIKTIETRLNDLENVSNLNANLPALIKNIRNVFLDLQEEILLIYQSYGNSKSEILSLNERILSPSDFGFHNAIIQDNGNIVFIDFEYAGWDDPAKLIGDFFNQVAIPINLKYLNRFVCNAFKNIESFHINEVVIKSFIRIYRIKWCCIILNIFLKKNLERRFFANPKINPLDLETIQINKAKTLLESLIK